MCGQSGARARSYQNMFLLCAVTLYKQVPYKHCAWLFGVSVSVFCLVFWHMDWTTVLPFRQTLLHESATKPCVPLNTTLWLRFSSNSYFSLCRNWQRVCGVFSSTQFGRWHWEREQAMQWSMLFEWQAQAEWMSADRLCYYLSPPWFVFFFFRFQAWLWRLSIRPAGVWWL